MKNIKYLFLLLATVFTLNSCEDGMPETTALNYVTFESTAIDLGVNIDGTSSYEITVYTTQVSGSDRTFNLMVDTDATTADPGAYDVAGTVTIPANTNEGRFMVTLNDVNIGDGKELVVKLDADKGVFTGEAATIFITQICDKNETFINITFDGYASECTWELFDSSDNLIGSGGGYADGQASASTKFCLENGNYTFNIYDSYGDGLTYPNLGGVDIISNEQEVMSFDGNYGTGKSVDFTL